MIHVLTAQEQAVTPEVMSSYAVSIIHTLAIQNEIDNKKYTIFLLFIVKVYIDIHYLHHFKVLYIKYIARNMNLKIQDFVIF